ncbi:hypothetical protein FDECE_14699 [Fusarium decemcellulare]|nr:hypothetical protein FDECE_14699 [Fusarium decemcellulare]
MKNDVVQLLAREAFTRPVNGTGDVAHYEYPSSRLQDVGYFILFFFGAAAFCVWTLRIYGRFLTKQYGWDDLFITLAMALSVAETVCSYYSMRLNFIGIHRYEIPPQADFVLGQRWGFVIQVLYVPILALVKTSVLLFLLRLGGQKQRVRLAIISLLTFNICQMVAMFVGCILQCTPIRYFWLSMLPGDAKPQGSCVNQSVFYIASAALTIFTDILVLMLPFWIFLGLSLPFKVRAAIIGVFALGAVVTAMSILRLAWLVEINYYQDVADPNVDFSYDIRFTYSAVETNLAIMTASVPALRPLFLKWFPNFFSGARSSGNQYTYAEEGFGNSTGTAKRSRGGTGVRNSIHGAFPLKDMRGRSEIRSHSPTISEEEIMTPNGILKTSEVAVQYGDIVPPTHLRDDSDTASSRFGHDTHVNGRF